MSTLEEFVTRAWHLPNRQGGTRAEMRAALQEYGAQRAAAATLTERNRCARLCELTGPEVLLLAGEMSAQELRTVRAVLASRAAAIRSQGGT